MAQLSLKAVKKTFGAVTVIPALDLAVNDGEFLVLVGPSGSGKSTLLRMIAGLEAVTSGAILVDGRDMTEIDPAERDMAMVFQSYALYPHMTVARNMAFALRMRGVDRAEIDRRVAAAVAMLGLEGLEARKPAQLSGGQRQRVAMGRAVVRRPKLFLFDEPLSNLDAKLRTQTRLEIKRLHQRLGATSILVTHDQVEAMTMADRIALLDRGELQQIGTPQDLYLRPANRFVAGFIGTPEMNVLAGCLAPTPTGFVLKGEHPLVLPASPERRARLAAVLASDQEVEVGVRPEHLSVGEADAPDALAVAVEAVEWMGADAFIFAAAGARVLSVRLHGLAPVPAEAARPPRVGERRGILAMEDRWHVFDAASGRNLDPVVRADA